MNFKYNSINSLLFTTLMLLLIILSKCESKGSLITLEEENWDQMLTDEWMVEFFAPWCPACRSLQPEWKTFSTWSHDLRYESIESLILSFINSLILSFINSLILSFINSLILSFINFFFYSLLFSIKVGAVDVTANPGLSGRFMVTALPTIYQFVFNLFFIIFSYYLILFVFIY